MGFTLRVENLRALRRVEWAPEGVCALVGANGAGKTTLFMVLKFLRLALEQRVDIAFDQVFGSSRGLRHRQAPEGQPIVIELATEDRRWRTTMAPYGTSISYPLPESYYQGGALSWGRDSSANFAEFPDGQSPRSTIQVGNSMELALDLLRHRELQFSNDGAEIRSFIEGAHIYHDPNLSSLRKQGSNYTDTKSLHADSSNAFAMLRMWNERREHKHRYEFVVEGLRAAFPGTCEDLDFESAANVTFVRTYARGQQEPTWISSEANGVLAMLVYLCNIASGDPQGLVAIDEPENSLHPFAIRVLMRHAEAWSRKYDCTIVFATHSPVILNVLNGQPERVWIMRTDAGDEPNPVRLDTFKDRDWLGHFMLGDLYADGEIGSNIDTE